MLLPHASTTKWLRLAVGYGDPYPVTFVRRIVVTILVAAGVGLCAGWQQIGTSTYSGGSRLDWRSQSNNRRNPRGVRYEVQYGRAGVVGSYKENASVFADKHDFK